MLGIFILLGIIVIPLLLAGYFDRKAFNKWQEHCDEIQNRINNL